jgi:hypothetical protein
MLVRRRPERNAISADNSSEVNRRARIGAAGQQMFRRAFYLLPIKYGTIV